MLRNRRRVSYSRRSDSERSGREAADALGRMMYALLSRAALGGALDELSGDNHRATAGNDQTVASELVERSRNRLAARSNHIGQLLLGWATANQNALGGIGALFLGQAYELIDQTLVDVT